MHDCLSKNNSMYDDDVEYWDVEFEDGTYIAGPFFEREDAEDYILSAQGDLIEEAMRYRVSPVYYL